VHDLDVGLVSQSGCGAVGVLGHDKDLIL
jgi:hypothetical protein